MTQAALPQTGMETVHGYKLCQLLGKGGSTEVWEAEAPDGARVALKFIPCDNEQAADREIRSIEAIQQLAHPNLITIKQAWKMPNFVGVAMEKAEGTLADLLDAYMTEFKTPVVREQVCLYLSQVADALDFLHAHKQQIDDKLVSYCHREVKPSNMLLFGDTVKLAEFGLAVQTFSWIHMARRTGMVDYAAPEVFKGHSNAQSDQFSLAVTYCEMRGGRLPYPKVESFMLKAPTHRHEPDLSALTPEERPIILRALDRLPENRWPTCGEMIDRLIQLVVESA
jgi:serine/threonine protein kinase